jgi:cytochrome c-type biogenesis protein CcsB
VNDLVLALYSDRLFMAAVGVYVLAMVLHAAEYAAARAMRPVAADDRGAPVAVGARDGAGGDPPTSPSPAAMAVDWTDTARPPRSRAERLGGAAVNLVVLGALLHLASVVARGFATDRWPLGNMYEFTSVFCLAAVITWLVVLRTWIRRGAGASRGARGGRVVAGSVTVIPRGATAPHEVRGGRVAAGSVTAPGLRAVGLFVLLPVVVLLFLAGTVLYAQAAPVVPALRSYWLVVHVTTITVSSGLLIVPGVASLLDLLRRSGRGGLLAERLPTSEALDRLAYRTTIVAFPLYTFGVIAGAIWAEAAWGRFWGWDPKETVAFVAWVVYAAYLHARATAGWRSGRAAWINVAGLAVVLFNLFFINMVVAGLHSYAGL